MRDSLSENPRAGSGLVARLLLLVLIPTLLFGAFQMFTSAQAQLELISDRQLLTAQSMAREVSSAIQEEFSALETAAGIINLTDENLESQEQILAGLLGRRQSFRQVVLLDAQGEELFHASSFSPELQGPLLAQFRDDRSFSQVEQEQRYVGPIYFDEITSEPAVIMAVPVTDPLEDFQGILAAEVNLRFLWNMVDQSRDAGAGRIYVVDKQGLLIAFADPSRVLKGENLSDLKPVAEFIQSSVSDDKSEVVKYSGIEGFSVFGTYASLGTPDWAVVAELPVSQFYSEIQEQALWSLVFILFMAVVVGWVGLSLARRLELSQ